MPDDILARYEHLSHRELYTMLMRGSTDQIDSLVATWKTMETTVSGLAASLRADLDRLRLGWDSPAGREFERRVGLIAEFAQTLAEEFCAIHTGLSVMSAALADAKTKAEHPDQPPHPDPQLQNLHGVGTLLHLLGSVVEGVIGSQLGHELDPAEKEKARNRMVQVVCTLAAEYRVVDYGTWPPRVPPPPVDTPQVRPEHVTVASAPVIVAQPQAQPATDPVTAAVDPSIHKPRHGHPDLPAPIPLPMTGLGDHDPNQQGTDFWGGTGPAIAAGVGLVAAGGVVAAAAIKSRHTKTSLGDDENLEPTVEPDTDGVVRSHPVPVGGGEGTTANLTAVGHDHSGVSATGGPSVHAAGSELAGSSREGAVSVGADGDTRGPGTAPPPPAVMGGMPGAPGGPGAPGPGGAGAAGTGSVGSSAGYGGGGYSGGGGGGGSSGYSYSGGSSAGSPGGAGYSGGAGPGTSGGAGPGGTGSGGATQLAAAGSSGPTAVGQGGGTGAIGGPGGGGGGGGGAGADRWQSDGPSPWGTTDTPDSSSLAHSDSSLVEDWDPEADD